jgi:hypothetical protein
MPCGQATNKPYNGLPLHIQRWATYGRLLFRWYDRVKGQKALGYRLLQASKVMTQALLIGNSNCIVWQDWVGLNKLPSITPVKLGVFIWMKISFVFYIPSLAFLLYPCPSKQVSKPRAEIPLLSKRFHHKTNKPSTGSTSNVD